VPERIARETGCSARSVREYLLETFPAHHPGTWWQHLEPYEIEQAVGELRTAAVIMPLQPRRAVRKFKGPQKMLVLY